jgi:hypothetical protein
MKKLKIKNWTSCIRDRNKWKLYVEKAKTFKNEVVVPEEEEGVGWGEILKSQINHWLRRSWWNGWWFQSKIGNIVFTNEVKLLYLIFLYKIAIGSLPMTSEVKRQPDANRIIIKQYRLFYNRNSDMFRPKQLVLSYVPSFRCFMHLPKDEPAGPKHVVASVATHAVSLFCKTLFFLFLTTHCSL